MSDTYILEFVAALNGARVAARAGSGRSRDEGGKGGEGGDAGEHGAR